MVGLVKHNTKNYTLYLIIKEQPYLFAGLDTHPDL